MATTLRAPALLLSASPASLPSLPRNPRSSVLCFSSKQGLVRPLRFKPSPFASRPIGWPEFRTFAASGDAVKAEEAEDTATKENVDEPIPTEDGTTDGNVLDTELNSTLTPLLQSYKEALSNGDESRVTEIEDFLQSFEDEKNDLATKVAGLSQVLSAERDRVLRISADFDNFRKRTERERLSLMSNVQGEVVESLLPVLDNFERAKTQIKVETEGEEKINNSYQSIYKQFLEILTSLGVETVETVGITFDPMLHEAIMREESTEYEEGIITQEFRKGFKLGDRLLRPSMVKVSAGPGPEKPEDDVVVQQDNEANEVSEEADDDSE